MSAAVDVGTGLTITAGTSAWSANITGIGFSGITVPVFNTSHAGTAAPSAAQIGNATYMPGRIEDAGELSIEAHFNPDTVPPIGTEETWTIQFKASGGDTTGASWAFTGIMSSFDLSAPMGESEEKMTLTATVKVDGAITVTAGS